MTFKPGQPRPANSGRRRGSLNKTTVAKAVGIEQVERAAGRKLAVERLAEAMEYWFGLAATHQPTGNRPNPKEFRTCLKEGTTCARDLAPYQSPKLQSTTLRQDAPQEPIQIIVTIVD
jgi:hypothetical protein